MEAKQHLKASHRADPFPFRWGIALILFGVGIIPSFVLIVKDFFFTGPWEMRGLELKVFEAGLLWSFISVFGGGLWATGLLSVLHLKLSGRIPSAKQFAGHQLELGLKHNKVD